MPLRVGISYGPLRGPYPNYHQAVRSAGERLDVALETIDLAATPEAIDEVDAILFTGGPDIDPAAYGMPEYLPLCRVDTDRDALEFKLLESASKRALPMFAICRGAQLVNVKRGGTLIPDLPDLKAVHHGPIGGDDRRHPVEVEARSALAAISGTEHGEVDSSHHQAIDRIAADFTVTARADDGTVEAYEWSQPEGKPYLLAVQWHPERMDPDSPLAGPLFERFVEAARAGK